jgi:hypothetical protein
LFSCSLVLLFSCSLVLLFSCSFGSWFSILDSWTGRLYKNPQFCGSVVPWARIAIRAYRIARRPGGRLPRSIILTPDS